MSMYFLSTFSTPFVNNSLFCFQLDSVVSKPKFIILIFTLQNNIILFLFLYVQQEGESTIEIEPEGESHTTIDSAILHEMDKETDTRDSSPETNVQALLSDPSQELTPQIEAAIKSKWQKIVGPDVEIVVNIYVLFKSCCSC